MRILTYLRPIVLFHYWLKHFISSSCSWMDRMRIWLTDWASLFKTTNNANKLFIAQLKLHFNEPKLTLWKQTFANAYTAKAGTLGHHQNRLKYVAQTTQTYAHLHTHALHSLNSHSWNALNNSRDIRTLYDFIISTILLHWISSYHFYAVKMTKRPNGDANAQPASAITIGIKQMSVSFCFNYLNQHHLLKYYLKHNRI